MFIINLNIVTVWLLTVWVSWPDCDQEQWYEPPPASPHHSPPHTTTPHPHHTWPACRGGGGEYWQCNHPGSSLDFIHSDKLPKFSPKMTFSVAVLKHWQIMTNNHCATMSNYKTLQPIKVITLLILTNPNPNRHKDDWYDKWRGQAPKFIKTK